MTAPNDDPRKMRAPSSDPFPLDMEVVDALLDGRVEVDDAPPGYGAVVALLHAADAPVRADELEDAPASIRRIFEEARRSPAPVPSPSASDSRRLAGRWSVRAAVAAVAVVFAMGGGVAMAATGSLPGPLQSAASRALGVVGITVPEGADDDPAGGSDPVTGTDRETDPAGDDPSDGSATTTSPSTVAPTTATPPPSPTTASTATTAPPTSVLPMPPTTPAPTAEPGVPGVGDEVCEEASDGRCHAGEPHPSDSRPSSPGPPTTKSNPSVTAPGKPTTTEPPSIVPATPTTRPHPSHP